MTDYGNEERRKFVRRIQEDDEQARILGEWNLSHQADKYDWISLGIVLLMVVTLGVVIGVVARCTVVPDPVAARMSIEQTDCKLCHMAPVARNLKEYDKQRRYRVRSVDLGELVR